MQSKKRRGLVSSCRADLSDLRGALETVSLSEIAGWPNFPAAEVEQSTTEANSRKDPTPRRVLLIRLRRIQDLIVFVLHLLQDTRRR